MKLLQQLLVVAVTVALLGPSANAQSRGRNTNRRPPSTAVGEKAKQTKTKAARELEARQKDVRRRLKEFAEKRHNAAQRNQPTTRAGANRSPGRVGQSNLPSRQQLARDRTRIHNRVNQLGGRNALSTRGSGLGPKRIPKADAYIVDSKGRQQAVFNRKPSPNQVGRVAGGRAAAKVAPRAGAQAGLKAGAKVGAKVGAKIAKGAGALGAGLSIGLAVLDGVDIENRVQRGEITRKQGDHLQAKNVGGAAGGAAGAAAGAGIGMAVCGPPCALFGALIGGLAGDAAGNAAGGAIVPGR